jgi:branched-chain amino acid aminotransferase
MTFERDPGLRRMSGAERTELLASRGIGRVHTQHMVLMDWNERDGWHSGRLVAYGPLQLDPSTSVLHYGHSVFEGMKAFRQADGGVAIFRLLDHARRFRRSARRLALPELPEETFAEGLEALVGEDYDWVPSAEAHSLYLRPMIFGSHLAIGFHPVVEARLLMIARPTRSYFPNGVQPVSVWVTDAYSRAARGGTGDVKCGGNYGGGLIAENEAMEHGCDEVLFLDADERRWVEEMGGMNVFFVLGSGEKARLVTPALTGTILPGNTRDALLTLASDLGIETEEGRLSIDGWQQGAADGSITEAFACGTAAVVTPIGSVRSSRGTWAVGHGEPGPVTMILRRALMDVQYGRVPDPHGWMHRVARTAPASAT